MHFVCISGPFGAGHRPTIDIHRAKARAALTPPALGRKCKVSLSTTPVQAFLFRTKSQKSFKSFRERFFFVLLLYLFACCRHPAVDEEAAGIYSPKWLKNSFGKNRINKPPWACTPGRALVGGYEIEKLFTQPTSRSPFHRRDSCRMGPLLGRLDCFVFVVRGEKIEFSTLFIALSVCLAGNRGRRVKDWKSNILFDCGFHQPLPPLPSTYRGRKKTQYFKCKTATGHSGNGQNEIKPLHCNEVSSKSYNLHRADDKTKVAKKQPPLPPPGHRLSRQQLPRGNGTRINCKRPEQIGLQSFISIKRRVNCNPFLLGRATSG